MKKTEKNGFTIVELVIVIAVIAILAAVLLPTFSSLIEKANLNNDLSFCKQLNDLLIIHTMDSAPNDMQELMGILLLEGYDFDDFKPRSKEHYFAYEVNSKKFILMDKDFLIKSQEDLTIEQLWILTTSEEIAETLYKNCQVESKFFVLELNVVREILFGDKVIYANESNIQELISTLTPGKEAYIQYEGDVLSGDIVLNDSILLTLDFGANDINEITFKNSTIENNGVLKIVNGILSSEFATMIINKGKLSVENVELISEDSNGANATIVNNGELSLEDCKIYSTGSACIKNEKEGEVIVESGFYKADCDSVVLNQGDITINGGKFIRAKNQEATGSNGSAYAVLSNVSTSTTQLANSLVNGGEFINEYTQMPSRRILSVVYNQNGNFEINDGTFKNNCDNSSAYVVYVKSRNSKLVLDGGTYQASNVNVRFPYCSGVNSSNIIISDITVYGINVLNAENYVLNNTYTFYNYRLDETPCIELTNTLPVAFEVSIDNNFYADGNMATIDNIQPNSVVVLKKSPQDFNVLLDRSFRGESNGLVLVKYDSEEECTSVLDDYLLKSIDLRSEYPQAKLAKKYYSEITAETATFMSENITGTVDYFAYAEWNMAIENARKVKLLKNLDVTSNEVKDVSLLCDMTFDLNGKTWKESGAIDYMFGVSASTFTLTIIDSSVSKTGEMIFNSAYSACGLFMFAGSVIIESGTFISNGNVFYMYGDNEYTSQYLESYVYSIKGGVFVGEVHVSTAVYHGTYSFSGGTFSVDPSSYLQSGYIVQKNNDGTWSVVAEQSVSTTEEKSPCDIKRWYY